jgi:hypothetical protein
MASLIGIHAWTVVLNPNLGAHFIVLNNKSTRSRIPITPRSDFSSISLTSVCEFSITFEAPDEFALLIIPIHDDHDEGQNQYEASGNCRLPTSLCYGVQVVGMILAIGSPWFVSRPRFIHHLNKLSGF